jgi:hypothetical protein
MIKQFISFVFLFVFVEPASATGDENYSVLSISKDLLKNANVVFRNHSTWVEIESLGKMRVIEKYAVTILNETGESYAQFVEHYDKLSSIKGIDGKLFDAMGRKIRELKKSEIKDLSNISDISLFEDNRVKTHNFYYKAFPYTVEYESEVVIDGTLFLPVYMPQRGYAVSVERSDYRIQLPVTSQLIYKKVNFNAEPVVTDAEKGRKIYQWTTGQLFAVQKELFSPAFDRIVPCIRFALTEFELEGYKGSNSSWKEFGKFQYELKKNRDELPENIKMEVRNLTTGLSSNEEKIKKLYEYLQSNTRYISVQLGIGGLQPFNAKYVASNRYGDCKALSNYMYALLKEAGIFSLYAKIKAGSDEDDIFTDFSTQQFNHVILCVPNSNDTIWLECTSQYTAAGYMGGFTGNRHALLIDESGGVLVRTPRYSMNENLQVRKIKAVLDEEATLTLKSETSYQAIQQDDLQGAINHLSKDQLKERLQNSFDFSTYTINAFDYKEEKGRIPVINESLDITIFNYANATGKRLFIVPNIMTKTYRRLSADSIRRFDIDLGFAYKDADSVEIQLPAGYIQESIPQDVNINSKFANYKASVQVKEGKLFYFRQVEYKGGIYPASDYAELVKYFDAVYKADRNRVVLIKKD